MTKRMDNDMPLYRYPKSVMVEERDPLLGLAIGILSAALAVGGVAAIIAFMLAHIVVIIVGVVGIGAVLTAETVYLYRRHTVVYMHEDAPAIIDAGLKAQQARGGLGHAAINAPPIPTPAQRPAIEGRRAPLLNLSFALHLHGSRARAVDDLGRQAIMRKTAPGLVIHDDELDQAVGGDGQQRAIRSAWNQMMIAARDVTTQQEDHRAS